MFNEIDFRMPFSFIYLINRIKFCSVTKLKENEEYSVGFQSDDRQMLLNVTLGSKFPNEKPKIVITPRIQHEWIPDPATGEVQSAPGLLNVISIESKCPNDLHIYFSYFLLI